MPNRILREAGGGKTPIPSRATTLSPSPNQLRHLCSPCFFFRSSFRNPVIPVSLCSASKNPGLGMRLGNSSLAIVQGRVIIANNTSSNASFPRGSTMHWVVQHCRLLSEMARRPGCSVTCGNKPQQSPRSFNEPCCFGKICKLRMRPPMSA